MNHLKHSDFISTVVAYVEANPDVAPYVSDAISEGIHNALLTANRRAADMETCLAVMVAKRYPDRLDFLKQKLTKWDGKTALNWTHVVEDKV